MNYIKQLQSDRASHAETAQEIERDIQYFLEYLERATDNVSAKELNEDVVHFLLPLLSTISYLANDLEQGVSAK